MRIKQATYLTSAVDVEGMIITEAPHVAVAGRSNVGKSSFINYLANNSKLARTSSQPGRTRMINYFTINNGEFYLVDLPGYGFAKASHEERAKWARLMEEYFTNAEIACVLVLVDMRHSPTQQDIQLVNMLNAYNISFIIIGTKQDKLKKNDYEKNKKMICAKLGIGIGNLYPTSSFSKTGANLALDRLEQILEAKLDASIESSLTFE